MRLFLVCCLFLLCGCGVFQNTINPPVTEPLPPGVTKEVLQMHKSLVKMQEQMASVTALQMPKPKFGVSWHDTNPPSAGVTEYRIYRGIGTNTAQATELIGVVLYPDTVFVDSTVIANTRYVYRISCYAGNSVADKESAKSNLVTGAWVNLGSLVKERDRLVMYDSIYTKKDLLVVTIPSFHPSNVQWIKTPSEKVTWVGEFDVDKNCKVDLADLAYYAQQVYNKSACDSSAVIH